MAWRAAASDRYKILCDLAKDETAAKSAHGLSDDETDVYRTASAHGLMKAARRMSAFAGYSDIRKEAPLAPLAAIVFAVVSVAFLVGFYLVFSRAQDANLNSLLAACAATAVAAMGWGISSWVAHKNAIRQNTTNLLFARFTQSPYMSTLHDFHEKFGYDGKVRIAERDLLALLNSKAEADRKAGAAIAYLLNYFEFIAVSVAKGDMDYRITRTFIRGILSHYYDLCEPVIMEMNRRNPRSLEYLIQLRRNYREP